MIIRRHQRIYSLFTSRDKIYEKQTNDIRTRSKHNFSGTNWLMSFLSTVKVKGWKMRILYGFSFLYNKKKLADARIRAVNLFESNPQLFQNFTLVEESLVPYFIIFNIQYWILKTLNRKWLNSASTHRKILCMHKFCVSTNCLHNH